MFDDHEDAWLPELQRSGWLSHARLLLGSSLRVALALREGRAALVHCSDGWDRTSQIRPVSTRILLAPSLSFILKTLVFIERYVGE